MAKLKDTTITGGLNVTGDVILEQQPTVANNPATKKYVDDAIFNLPSVGTVTSVALASGTNQGTVKLTVNGVATDNIQATTLATTNTPTFSGVSLGAGSNTWTIDDTTTNQLRFSHTGAGTAILPKVSSGTKTIAFTDAITDAIEAIIDGDTVVAEARHASKAGAAPSGVISHGGSTINLSSSDANRYLTVFDQGSPITVNLSLSVSNNMAIGDEIHIASYSKRDVTITVGSGLTLKSLDSKKKIAGQYGVVTLKKITSTQWHLFGALK